MQVRPLRNHDGSSLQEGGVRGIEHKDASGTIEQGMLYTKKAVLAAGAGHTTETAARHHRCCQN